MYLDYWQFERKPFEPPAEGGFFYPSESHQGALLKLRYAIENRRGAAVLAGPSGVGKSLLVDTLITQVAESITPVIRVLFPQMTTRELLAYLAERATSRDGATRESLSIDRSWGVIEDQFAQCSARGEHPLIIIEEAHLLEDAGALEAVRLLLNLQNDGAPLATVLLVGQPPLLATLARTPRLEERMDISAVVTAFSPEETAKYVEHRLKQAGAPGSLFTSDACDALQFHSQGIARRINRLGDLSLLIGFANQAERIDATLVESVASELSFSRAA